MSLFDDILQRDEFRQRPPVLLDIGSSGALDPKWRRIAKYAVCVAFDPDARDMTYISQEQKHYQRICVIPKIVHASAAGDVAFHLTRSPSCSSTLPPLTTRLQDWHFAGMFAVERTVAFPATTLPEALAAAGVTDVDWFKTDSQGTDLRLFQSLGAAGCRRVLVAEFEPGLIDAYAGEDKFWHLLQFMDTQPHFCMASCRVLGDRFLPHDLAQKHFGAQPAGSVPRTIRIAPGWVEVVYLNLLRDGQPDLRSHLLGWVFATIAEQHGIALLLADSGQARFPDPVFARLVAASRHRIRWGGMPLWERVARKVYGFIR